MATNIQSTQLDFATIKNSLKTYLAQQNEFTDYNFEASGLSNILDVLAHNTHFNGLIANFALNESFLNTAQLRSSVVSHAEALGYNPRSITSAIAYVNLSLNISAAGRPSTIVLPRYTAFTSSVDDIAYTFYTLESYIATDDGTGNYVFLNSNGTSGIPIVEGTLQTKTFFVGQTVDRQIYVIPDATIDTTTVSVNVFTSATSSNFNVYTPLFNAITVDSTSTLYQLKEAPNGFYELIFSDGITTGRAPVAGNKIVVNYLASSGTVANTAASFVATNPINVNGTNYNISVATSVAAAGGAEKESIESIRLNAPVAFAAQQRLVTAADYKALILSNYSVIDDCIAWGGEDNLPNPEYGKVFVSLKFPDNFSEAAKTTVKNSIQQNLITPLSVLSINTEFVEPVTTFLECETFFRFNPSKTNVTLKTTENNVFNIVRNYFTNNLNKFNSTFRRSNILTEIDNLGDWVLNSRMDVKLQQRFIPTLSVSSTYTLSFPVPLAAPDDVNYIISSNPFQFNNAVCVIRNKLNTSDLEVVDVDGNVQVNNIGSYNANTGIVTIAGFAPVSISGGLNYIRISVIPANQSTIPPLRNYVLNIDTTRSFASGIIDFDKTQVAI